MTTLEFGVIFYDQTVDRIEELRQRSKKREIITLLCYYEKGEYCHRYTVKSMIEGSSTVTESDRKEMTCHDLSK